MRIIVKSLNECLQATGPKCHLLAVATLRVDLSGGKLLIQPFAFGGQHKFTFDAKIATDDIENTIKQRLIDDPKKLHVVISFENFDDSSESSTFTANVVGMIGAAFRAMKDCKQIIINCETGRQRAPMIASRVAALLLHGLNKPSTHAYDIYKMICEQQCIDNSVVWTPDEPEKWPKFCTNSWTQAQICIFMHGKSMYPKNDDDDDGGGGNGGGGNYRVNVMINCEHNQNGENGCESDEESSNGSETIPFPLPSDLDLGGSNTDESD
jgi:hypothetical protein